MTDSKMSSDDSFFQGLSPFERMCYGDCYMELEMGLLPPESATSEARDDEQLSSPNRNQNKLNPRRNRNSGGANPKRKRKLNSESSSKAKGKSTKKGRGTFCGGESSASQQADSKIEQELIIEKKTVRQEIKILRDRVDRRIKNDKEADKDSCIILMRHLMFYKISDLFPSIVASLDEIREQWPVRSDLQNIQKKIKEMAREANRRGIAGMKATDEMKRILLEVEEEIENLDKQRQEDSVEAENLQNIFMTEGVSVEILREKLSSAFPWFFLGEIATNGPTSDQDQGSLQTREQLQYTDNDLENSLNELFAKDNNKVDVSHFQGLKEAIKETTGRNIPDYLKAYALEIKEARGKATEFVHGDIEILVCAALHEMRYAARDGFDQDKLKKWGATFNMANEFGFQVKFAEEKLKKIFKAYLMLTQK